jgi:tetratricopeptide (TPR) repeat protein
MANRSAISRARLGTPERGILQPVAKDREGERPPGGRVISIADRIEKRQMARLREQSAKMHVRKLEAAVAWLDIRKQIEQTDYDAQLAALDRVDTAEARRHRGEMRSLRGLQSCFRGDCEAGYAEWDEVAAVVPDLALPHFLRARWLMDAEPRAALAHFDRAAEIEPTDASLYWRRGDCYTKLGDHERALANYHRALALDPSSIDGLYATAGALVALGRPREALRYYDDAIARAPRYVDFYTSRGIALEVLDEHAAAVRDYERILEIDPSNVVARFSRARCRAEGGEIGRAIEELTALAAAHPEVFHFHLLLGKLLMKEERWPAAEEALSRAVEVAPGEAEALGQRAVVLARRGDRGRALADAERASELAPTSPEYAYVVASLRHAPDDLAGRIAELEGPIERFPDTGLFLHERAGLHAERGDHSRALADWDTLLASWPDDPSCRIGRAKSLAAMDLYAEALEEVTKARALAPEDAMVYGLAANYRDHLDGDEAIIAADWDRAAELAPDDVAIRYHRGHFLEQRDRYEAALADFDRAVALAPSLGEAYYHRGFCRYQLDEEHLDDEDWEEDDAVREARYQACVADFERALELGHRDEDVFVYLHWAHWELDERAAAVAALTRGIDACPTASALFNMRHYRRLEMKDEEGAEADRLRAQELDAAAKDAG